MRAHPALKMMDPDTMEAFSPMKVMRKPVRGITVPWVIPHVDCTNTKSANYRQFYCHCTKAVDKLWLITTFSKSIFSYKLYN